jgi:hypothetical protein
MKKTSVPFIPKIAIREFQCIPWMVWDSQSLFQTKLSDFISEKDNGIYDAMNKGIKAATGNIIGFLNSDDFFYDDNVVSNIVNQFTEWYEAFAIRGGHLYVPPEDRVQFFSAF